MIVGESSVFAIEAQISRAVGGSSQQALGYFNIHVAGMSYGVKLAEATMLGCSAEAVRRRCTQRGTHLAWFTTDESAFSIADATMTALYDEDRQSETFFGMSSDMFRSSLYSHNIIWAPDGDEAFDDGGHVLQFDQANEVRLIAFKNVGDGWAQTLTEAYIASDEFYGILQKWLRLFETERAGLFIA